MPRKIFDRTDKKRQRVDAETMAVLRGEGRKAYSYDRRTARLEDTHGDLTKGQMVRVTKGYNKDFKGKLKGWDTREKMWALHGGLATVWAKPENLETV